MNKRRQTIGLGLVATASLMGLSPLKQARAQAQHWPNKAIKIIVPYPTAGVSDTIVRMLAERLTVVLGQPVIIENRAGAGATLGMDMVARAAPDGYTLGFAAISPLTLNPHVMKVPYDSLKDFAPVGSAMYSPIYLLATPKFKGKTFDDVIAMSRANPGSLTVATSGYGTVGHIMLEQLNKKAGITLTHVPYKGGAQISTDALGGQFDLMFANPYANLNAMIEQGKLNPLAVGSPNRLANLPQMRTFAELGFPEVNLTSLFGFFAPGGTPLEIINQLNTEINKVLNEPDTQARVKKVENLVITSTPAAFAAIIKQEFAANARIVKEADIKAE
jgi:tripartite-type tricarboxylate transporter receptor subunit TctC